MRYQKFEIMSAKNSFLYIAVISIIVKYQYNDLMGGLMDVFDELTLSEIITKHYSLDEALLDSYFSEDMHSFFESSLPKELDGITVDMYYKCCDYDNDRVYECHNCQLVDDEKCGTLENIDSILIGGKLLKKVDSFYDFSLNHSTSRTLRDEVEKLYVEFYKVIDSSFSYLEGNYYDGGHADYNEEYSIKCEGEGMVYQLNFQFMLFFGLFHAKHIASKVISEMINILREEGVYEKYCELYVN
jgi:hypothetical protein